jgi:hypothetical protein
LYKPGTDVTSEIPTRWVGHLASDEVDIDDVVYLIAYILQRRQESLPDGSNSQKSAIFDLQKLPYE